jgi:HPt (histidine-containing phosphotransfer) domain-containing protein
MSETSSSSGYLGKYREIIIAVGFFLVFDLAVLVLNFYVSFQISASAVEINLAGRQRMLSQRMTKELLVAVQDQRDNIPTPGSLEAVGKSVKLFDQTLTAFKSGGKVMGGNDKEVMVNAIASAEGQDILAQADAIWQPLLERVNALQAHPDDGYALQTAVLYARQNNVPLLKLMNQLTTKLEQAANARADMLRQVQTIGIVLALLNFAFILFKFIRRLRDNDRKVEQAQSETTEILATVKEGLFLLDHDFKIGSQFSASLVQIIGQSIKSGDDFRMLLAELIPSAAYKSACEYIQLLLGDRVKESLVQDLNPLTNMAVMIHGQQRYLTLSFNRALKEGKVSHLLVTVFDVTAQVQLELDLAEARKKAKAEMEVLLDLLKINPATLKQYLGRAEKELLSINDQLRHLESSRDYRRTINVIFRQIHTLKGEAAVLGLAMFEELAHKFELMLVDLRNKGTVTGSDLLAIPLPLDEFLQRISHVRELSQRLSALQSAFPSEDSENALIGNMKALVDRIAADHAKQIALTTELALLEQLPSSTRNSVSDITLQLLRNAIVHGIESRPERLKQAKPETGKVHISLQRVGDEFELSMRDDGRGLIPKEIRQSLLEKGMYSEAQLKQLDDRQIIMKIFESGFSTVDTASRDAGHGVGLDVVKHMLGQLGASLRISTKEHVYTQFNIRFPVSGGVAA